MPDNPPRRPPRGGTRKEVRGLKCATCGRAIGPGEGYESGQDGNGQVRHTIRLYVDECAVGLRKILTKMGFCVASSMPHGTPDTEWLTHAGKEGFVVVTHDAQIARNDAEHQAIIANKVRCFILPGTSKGIWDSVRHIAGAWGKIRGESVYPGPFIWRLEERVLHPWTQLYPEPRQDYKPPDFSATPVGHLLNLFADVICQHDDGWFSERFVQRLHDHIRLEIEARITRDRSMVPTPVPGEKFLDVPMGPGQEDSHGAKFTTPLDTSSDLIVEIVYCIDDTGVTYQWLVPARRLGFYLLDPRDADTVDDDTFGFQAGSTGFHRCGFGLRIRKP